LCQSQPAITVLGDEPCVELFDALGDSLSRMRRFGW
jgi:hypothetical protein